MKTVIFLDEGMYVYPDNSGWDTFEVFAGEELEIEDATAQYLAKQYRTKIRVIDMPASYYIDWYRDVEIVEDDVDDVSDISDYKLNSAIDLSPRHLEALRDGQLLEVYIGGNDYILLRLNDDR